MKNRWQRALIAVLAACGLTMGVLAVTTAPAAAATQLAHTCARIGSIDRYGNYAVECVDLYWEADVFEIRGSNDISCWDSSDNLVECAGIIERPGTCRGDSCEYAGEGRCGAYYGHTPCGVRRVINYGPWENWSCGTNGWAITIGTRVRLPGSGTFVDGGLVGVKKSKPC